MITAIAGIVGGAVTVIIWASIDILKNNLYEIIPGFIVGLAAIWIVSLVTEAPNAKQLESFDEYKQSV